MIPEQPTYEALAERVQELEKIESELRETEHALRQSEAFHRAIVACSPVALYSVGLDGHVITWNASATRILGWTADEVVGKPLPIVPLDKQDEFLKLREQVYSGKTLLNMPLVRQKKDGRLFDANLSAAPILDDDGKIVGIMAAMEDITEKKGAEEALRKSEERFRFLAENMVDLVWTMDLHFRTTYVSPSIEKVLGFTPEERRCQTLEEMVTPESLEKIQTLFAHEFSIEKKKDFDPIRSMTVEIEYYKKSGGTVWCENRVKWIRDEAGAIIGIHGVSRDISERRQAEIEREKLQNQLFQAQKMESVGRLAGGVAHDFNNMLGVILGRAEMMAMGMTPEDPLYTDIEEIQKAARRSAELTRQLLGFARKQTISPKVMHLNDTLEGMLKMLRRLIGEDIDLIWKPDADLWPVQMDPVQMDQVLVNLCVNARDAVAGNGNITIHTENVVFDEIDFAEHAAFLPGEYVMLAVGDDGCGMDDVTRAQIFEPFFTTRGVGEGTGLGLSTVYGIVKQNNGFMDVSSEPGKGSIFRIYIPRYHGSSETEKTQVPGKSLISGRETILLVEDDPGILAMGKAMLERLGYTVLTAKDPKEALVHAEAHAEKIHLLMTDVVMPQMSGKDLAKQIQAGNPGMKILFMSGYTADIIAHHGVLDKGVRFIQKPFSLKELAETVRKAMDL